MMRTTSSRAAEIEHLQRDLNTLRMWRAELRDHKQAWTPKFRGIERWIAEIEIELIDLNALEK